MKKLDILENGLKVITIENTGMRSVAAGIFVGCGSVTETEAESGISHLIEHMVFKGTKTRGAFDIVNEVDGLGAQINAFTSKTYTCFYTVSLDTHADK